jgi:DNA-binding response OmpR family regulator/CO dehydrogenase nickel-insertion accessory protein CooC1
MTHKILVIDDHLETITIIQRVLQQQGYDVISARSGVRGLALATKELPDLILLDVMMPEMDGREVCRRLRATARLADVPIIMFTAMSEADEKLAGFDAGADDYLTKPTEPGELVERVKALLVNVTPHAAETVTAAPMAAEEGKILSSIRTHNIQEAAPAATMDLPLKQRLIVVVGARGGAGTTTMAINLAVSMAETGQPTRLIDLDLVQGHIALYLNQKVTGGVNALATLSGQVIRQQATRYLVNYGNNLQLLLAQPNLLDHYPLLSVNQITDLVETLTQSGHCVMIDAGRGFTAANRPLLERADQIIVCLRPERVALAAARQLLEALRATLFSQNMLHAVLIDFSGGMNAPKSAIEGFLGHPLWALVSLQPQELAQAVNKGLPLVKYQPEAKAAILIRQMAQRLAKTES